jgi:hypothetical protein
MIGDDDRYVFFNTDEFGESAVYEGVTITVVRETLSDSDTGNPGFVTPSYTVFIDSDEVAIVKAGDSVVFNGDQCTVDDSPSLDGGVWTVVLIKDTIQV